MGQTEISPDLKGQASLTLGEVIVQTRTNFPIKKYQPRVHFDTPYYHLYGIDPSPHQFWPTADGIGTKPEFAERLIEESRPMFGGSPQGWENLESLAFDLLAMIDGDEARWGRVLLGIVNNLDLNTANPGAISALARGVKRACDEGQFALLNGETAELGYRVSGYGDTRINWNAVGVSLVIPDKYILGTKLKAGQPIVAFKENSFRSNGSTPARKILEAAYLHQLGYPSKKDYVFDKLIKHLEDLNIASGQELDQLRDDSTIQVLDDILSHNFLEQVLVPWSDVYSDLAQEILKPSTLYGNIIKRAQGWVDEDKQVQITAAAHITGGGIPEKAMRMVKPKGLGIHLNHYEGVFPDPESIKRLLQIAEEDIPEEQSKALIDDRRACEVWNRGIGFLVATATERDATILCVIAQQHDVVAGVIGHVIEEQKIEWRGHTWTY